MANVYETFGKYKLTERIAFGGMAEVFLGTVHGEAGFIKPVVIKRLHPRLSEDSEFVQMLIDEARITSQLTHSNICQVLDLGSVDGSYYIAMEYISGEDLRTIQDHLIRQKRAMPIEAALHIISEVAAGLDYAHRKPDADGQPLGIVHRDISPQNVLVSYEGEVKVIDFGIAKARSKVVQTEAGVIKGKFRYMAPEQASGTNMDHRTDIFAAGVVLYELLRGRPHSTNVGDTEVLRRMRKAEFEPLRRQRPEVSAKLEKTVRKALSLKVGNRYATAEEFRVALLKQQQAVGVHFGRAELATMMTGLFDAERRQRRSPSFAGSVVPAPLPQARDPRRSTAPVLGRPEKAPAVRRRASPQPPPDEVDALEATTLAQSKSKGPDGWVAFAPTTFTDSEVRQTHRGAGAPPPQQQPRPPVGQQPVGEHPGDDDATNAFYHLGDDDLDPMDDDATTARQSSERRTLAQGGSDRRTIAQGGSDRRTIAQGESDRRTIAVDSVSASQQETGVRPDGKPYRSRVGAGAFHRQQTQSVQQEIHKEPTNILQPAGQVSTQITTDKTDRLSQQTDLTRGQSDAKGGSGLKTVVGVLVVLLIGGGLAVGFYHYDRSQALVGVNTDDAGVGLASSDLGGAKAPPTKTRRRARLGLIRVKSKPQNAAIILCGLDTGKVTPATVRARVGRRCTLELQLEDHESYKLPVVARRGKPINIMASLRRSTQRPPPPSGGAAGARRPPQPRTGRGTLRVTSIQAGAVFVNGKRLGHTPRFDLSLAPGIYSVRVYFSSLEQYTPTRQVTVRAGQTSTVHFDAS